MKSKFLKCTIASVILTASILTNVANAGIITVTDTQIQTTDFQDFDFSFAISDWQAGTGADLYVEVQADLGYSQGTVSEVFDLLVESINLGTHGGFNDLGLGGWTLLSGGVNQDVWRVSQIFSINSTDMGALLADNSFDVDVNFSEQVHIAFGIISNIQPYVTLKLEYQNNSAVPEPSTLAIFALGSLCLVSRRFKK